MRTLGSTFGSAAGSMPRIIVSIGSESESLSMSRTTEDRQRIASFLVEQRRFLGISQ
jgi:hypothetical protein